MAVTFLAKALHKLGCQLSLLSMNTTKHPVEVEKIRSHLKHYEQVHYSKLDNEVKPLHAFLNLFSSDSYNISRFESAAFANKLQALLQHQTFDVIQLESLYLAPYINIIRKYSNARIFLRAHNVEHEIWDRIATNEEMALRRWYLEYSARKLKKYEIDQLDKIDFLLPISNLDDQKFRKLGFKGSSLAVPIGLDLLAFPYSEISTKGPLSVSFIGSLDWMPNIEGLDWFLHRVWPHLNIIFPSLSLHVAGRNCPDWIANLKMKNLFIKGEVEDSKTFLLQHPVTVVPLKSGSGMRAKIIESMALGRIVIASSLGLEGINAEDGKEVLIANHDEDYIRHFRFCYNHRNDLSAMGLQARQFAEKHCDYIEIGATVLKAYELALNSSKILPK
jgi:glycosyltransferase involved in cell wall biosynthesis